jgi:hypothetical protein
MAVKKQRVLKSKSTSTAKVASREYVIGENVNVPGYTQRLDATMYRAMHQALMKVLPDSEPGLTQNEMREAVVPHLPEDLFPAAPRSAGGLKRCNST